MKGFGIYVKNNLLEAKHVENMGAAVWLYLWLLDRMTSVNENGIGKVLKSRPIIHEMIELDLGISKRTYLRWIERLRDSGYINTIQAPYGLVITVNKAEKIFGKRSANNGISDQVRSVEKPAAKKREVPKVAHPEVPKVAHLRDKNGTSNNNNTSYKTKKNNTVPTVRKAAALPEPGKMPDVLAGRDDLLSNAIKPAALKREFGSPEIAALLKHFESVFDLKLKRVKQQRWACNNLIRRYGEPKVRDAVIAAAAVRDEKYAPTILDFQDLWEKWDKLVSFYRKHQHAQASKVAVITDD